MKRSIDFSIANRSRAVANGIADALQGALARQEKTILAVLGGRTARAVLPELNERDLPSRRIMITLTDERWVSPPHGDSNETPVRALCATSEAAVAGLYRPDMSPEAAVRCLTQEHPGWDVILLGEYGRSRRLAVRRDNPPR